MSHTKSEKSALVYNIQRYSIHDGPGIRTLVFFKGCPLRCDWCSNPESQKNEKDLMIISRLCIRCGSCMEICPQEAISLLGDAFHTDRKKCLVCGKCETVCPSGARKIVGTEMKLTQVMDEVRKDQPFYRRSKGGITLGGGEPTVWADFAYDLLWLCLEEGINTAIETCGHTSWDKLKLLVPVTHQFFYDLKCMDENTHKKYTGFSNKLILENLTKLSKLTKNIVVRIPIIPNVNDSEKNINDTARFVKKLNGVREVELLPYHQFGVSKYNNLGRSCKLIDTPFLSDDRIDRLTAIVSSYGIKCISENS